MLIKMRRQAASWLLLTAISQASFAQQNNAPLDELIVTATRLKQSLNNVAAAVTIVNEDDIQLARQQLALDESLSRVPGVFLQNRYNFAQDLRVSIRGFGARANFGIRGVKILIDGIPATLPDGQGSVDSIDIGSTSRIEVLRGPSSSLYGNASGGVISVTSEAPPTETETQVRVSAGDYGFRKLQAKFGGTVSNMGYSVSVSDTDLDGYRAQNRAKNTQLNSRLNFDLSNDRNLLAVFNYTDQPVSDDPGGINAAQASTDPRSARAQNISFDGGETLEQTRLGLVYSMPINSRGELSARSYFVSRDFTNKLPFTGGGQVALDRTFLGGGISYTHRGQLGSRNNELIIGLDFDSQDDDRQRFNNNSGIRGALTFDQNEAVESRGLFLQNILHLTDSVDFSFGIRFDDIEFDVTDRFLSDGDDSGILDFSDTSPMLGINVALSENTSVYGNYSTSFETPTTTELANPSNAGGFNPNLRPQNARNFEVGLRSSLNQIHYLDTAVFNIEVDDELIPFEDALFPGRDFYSNAGSSTRTGIEFALVSQWNDTLQTTFSYTISDFEFDEFVADGNDYSGNDIPGIADSLFFGELIYTNTNGWFASLDIMHVGEQFANNSNAALVDSYTVSNARFGTDLVLGNLQVSPFIGINNLSDEVYFSNIRINAFGGRFFEPAPDRNFYAGVTIDFGQ